MKNLKRNSIDTLRGILVLTKKLRCTVENLEINYVDSLRGNLVL